VNHIPVKGLDVPVIHLQIESNDRRPIHNWMDLQRIKNEILGDEEEALEMYPAQSDLVNDRNAYHLWSVPESNGFLTRLLGWGKQDDGFDGDFPWPDDPEPPMNEENQA
jgi:hypothetical protein